MSKKKKNILIWITGLSGSGKTSLGKKILEPFSKKYGPTLLVNGDDLREIFNLKKYDKKGRKKIALNYSRFADFIYKQNINVIFCCVALFHEVHKQNRKNIKNYTEVFVDANLKKIISLKKKKIYKYKKNIVGKNIKAELPINPHITLSNNFKKSINFLAKNLMSEIKKIYR